MKRTPLNRRTALVARTPLSRGIVRLGRRTPLMATASLSRSPIPAGLRRQPPPRPAIGGQQKPFPLPVGTLLDSRDISLLDMERCCQRCGNQRNLERHHRRGKAMGGSQHRPHAQCACNGVTLCRKCHRFVHRKGRLHSEAQGFIVSQSVDWPGSVSVMRFCAAGGGASQFPSCDGRWLDESAMGVAA